MIERGCPSPADVERAYWTTRGDHAPPATDADLHAHVMACDGCRDAWDEIAKLSALGQTLEPSPTWERRDEVRTTLLSKNAAENSSRAPSSVLATLQRFWFAPLAAAAALVLRFAWPASRDDGAPARRAVVMEHEGARATVVAEQPDEIVRLAAGKLTITVPVLAANERFRVITGDGEVTASGAAFDITAREDRLVAVRVIHGQVRLLAAGATKALGAGDSWTSSTELAVVSELASSPVPSATAAAAPPAPTSVATAPIDTTSPAPPSSTTTSQSPRALGPASATSAIVRGRPAPTPPPASESRDAKPETASTTPAVDVPAEAVPVTPPPAPARPRSMAQQALDDGWTALRANEFAKAATAFERATTVTNDRDVIEDATFWRGVALARGGEVGTAVHVLTAFTRGYPRSTRIGEANVMLGWLLFERSDHTDARARFDAAAKDASVRVRESANAGLAALARRLE